MSDTHPTAPESTVEGVKRESRALRGAIAATLAGDAGHFADGDKTLIKFHGIYQQDDRDQRRAQRDHQAGRAYSFMVRVAIPGGVLTAAQYLALDRLADAHANGTLRLTTRQGLQFHGVLLGDLKAQLGAIHRSLLTTLAACGDVRRNVMACPAPWVGPIHQQVQATAAAIAQELAPTTRAYHEIWLDGERVEPAPPEAGAEEPFYGAQYLPRKFKIAVGLDFDNCVDVFSQDCALVALTTGRGAAGRVRGYQLLAGGGLGMTHNKPDTIARLASMIGFVEPAGAVAAVKAVAAIFRDHGDRTDRRHARLKYLLEAWGVERFRAELARRLGFPLLPPETLLPLQAEDHLGRHAQGDGREFLGVFVQSGRVEDRPGVALRTALREVITRHQPAVRLTAQQGLLLGDLTPATAREIEAELEGHGVVSARRLAPVRRGSMACPALPTCGLALTDAERALPDALDTLEAHLAELGLGDVPLAVRMTGCPNGCARPYNADIAFVGRKPGVYHVFVGGGAAGDRLADLFAADVAAADFVAVLHPLLARFRAERQPGEGLGDFYQRLTGRGENRRLLSGREVPSAERLGLGRPAVQLEVAR